MCHKNTLRNENFLIHFFHCKCNSFGTEKKCRMFFMMIMISHELMTTTGKQQAKWFKQVMFQMMMTKTDLLDSKSLLSFCLFFFGEIKSEKCFFFEKNEEKINWNWLNIDYFFDSILGLFVFLAIDVCVVSLECLKRNKQNKEQTLFFCCLLVCSIDFIDWFSLFNIIIIVNTKTDENFQISIDR